MILTKELLIKLGACQEGIDFCERNKLFGFDTNNIDNVVGDYDGIVSWIKYILTECVIEFDAYGNVILFEDNNIYNIYEYEYYPNSIIKQYTNYEGNYRHTKNDIKIKNDLWFTKTYNENGKILSFINNNGFFINYSYDDINKELLISTRSTFNTIKYEYNESNQLILQKYNNDEYNTYYEYDYKGNLIKKKDSNSYGLIYMYDENNTMIYEHDLEFIDDITCLYDNDRLIEVVYYNCPHIIKNKFTYDDNGFIFKKEICYNDKNTRIYTYYPTGQLKEIQEHVNGKVNILSIPFIS